MKLTKLFNEGLEAKIPRIISTYGHKAEKANLSLSSRIIQDINHADPTKNHAKYTPWLVRQYVNQRFKVELDTGIIEDLPNIQFMLRTFEQHKNHFPSNDINQYSLNELKTLAREIGSKFAGQEESEINFDKLLKAPNRIVKKRSSTAGEGTISPYTLIEINQYAGMEELKDPVTSWCVAYPDQFKEYGPPFHLVFRRGEPFVLMHYESDQFKDIDDEPIGKDEFDEIKEFIDFKRITGGHDSRPFGSWANAERAMLNPHTAADRAFSTSRWPEAESMIMKNPKAAMYYAQHVIKGRWREAEPYIMQDPLQAHYYAQKVIRGRWREAEPVIMQNPTSARDYANKVIKGRWRKAEPVIFKDAKQAVYYAISLATRLPEAEPSIMKNPRAAAYYAHHILKGRWPEAEPIIMKDKFAAELYQRHVLDKHSQ